MNFVLGPRTLTTGCSPIVLVTTPAQPASNARMIFVSDSVGGAEDNRNGFSSVRPVKTADRRELMTCLQPYNDCFSLKRKGAPHGQSFCRHGNRLATGPPRGRRTPQEFHRRPMGGTRRH